MTRDLVIAGAGGFGRETLDVVEAINAASDGPVWRVLGVVDDAPSVSNRERLKARSAPYLGTVDDLISIESRPYYVVGIGSPTARRIVADRLDGAGFEAATLIHPDATLGRPVRVGAGSVICAGSRVTTNITLGRHVHLNPNVTIGHDSTLGDFVSLNPASSVSGDCVVGDGVLIGVAAVVLNGLAVGSGATVGASACVVKNVPSDIVVKGVPAR